MVTLVLFVHIDKDLIIFLKGIEMEIINSCDDNNGGCFHHCDHSTNGPLCSCNQGYILDLDGKTCTGNVWSSIYIFGHTGFFLGSTQPCGCIWSFHTTFFSLVPIKQVTQKSASVRLSNQLSEFAHGCPWWKG